MPKFREMYLFSALFLGSKLLWRGRTLVGTAVASSTSGTMYGVSIKVEKIYDVISLLKKQPCRLSWGRHVSTRVSEVSKTGASQIYVRFASPYKGVIQTGEKIYLELEKY